LKFNIGSAKCQSCGRLKQNHTAQEVQQCQKHQEIEKQKRQGKYFQRLALAQEIIRKEKRISRLNLSREIDKKISTTPWTIDKMKKDILEESFDIKWDGKLSQYYIDSTLDCYICKQDRLEKSFSLSQNFEDLR